MKSEDLIIFISTTLVILNPGLVMILVQIIFLGVVNDFYIALLATSYWIPIFIVAPLWGRLADITDRRYVASFTQFAASVATFLHAVFPSYISILVLRFLTGFFSAAYTPAIQGYMTTGLDKRSFGGKLSVYNTGVAFGFLVSGFLLSLALAIMDPLKIFVLASISSLLAGFLILVLPKKRPIEFTVRRGLLSSVSSLGTIKFLSRGRAYLLVVALGVRHIAVMGLFSIIFLYLQRVGIEREILGILASTNNLVQLSLIIPLGRLADRVGYKKLFVPGFFMSAFIPLVFLFARDLISSALAFAYIGLAYSLLIAGANPYLREAAPEGHESEVLSLVSTTRAFGMIFGPILAGSMIQLWGYEYMFIILSVVGFVGAFLSLVPRDPP